MSPLSRMLSIHNRPLTLTLGLLQGSELILVQDFKLLRSATFQLSVLFWNLMVNMLAAIFGGFRVLCKTILDDGDVFTLRPHDITLLRLSLHGLGGRVCGTYSPGVG